MTNHRYTKIHWHDDAAAYAESYGLTKADCEKILLSKSNPKVDSRSHEVGHLIVRYRAGDVVVVVGHRDRFEPIIMSVWVDHHDQRQYGKGSGNTGVAMPKTVKDLTKRILAAGYKVEHGGSHMRVVDQDGVFVCSFSSTPSDKYSIPNAWRAFNKRKQEIERNKKESEDG